MSAKVTKRNVAYKVSIGRQNGFSAYKVYSYSHRHEMWVESSKVYHYWAACQSVKESKERWNTREQRYED